MRPLAIMNINNSTTEMMANTNPEEMIPMESSEIEIEWKALISQPTTIDSGMR